MAFMRSRQLSDLKLALWYEEMKRNLERFRHAADGVQFGKMSGAVGTYANIDPFVEEFVCRKLGITASSDLDANAAA